MVSTYLFPAFFYKPVSDVVRAIFRVAVTYGHPSMIDVNDCDARLPSSGDETDLYLDYLARLSLILGRVMKNIYTCVRRASARALLYMLTAGTVASAVRPG